MQKLKTFYFLLTDFVWDAFVWVVDWLVAIERWFHVQLQPLNLPPEAETVVLLFAFLLLGFAVAKLMAGLIRILLLVILLALTADILVPALLR